MQATLNVVSELPRHIFRAYDIRGLIEQELTPNAFFTIGKALAVHLHEQNQTTTVLGYDGRLSSPSLAEALKQGLLTSGINVIAIGCVPSPILYYALSHLKVGNGVIITGSHNPSNYNGIKMVVEGQNLTKEGVASLYHRVQSQQFQLGQGHYSETNVIEQYIAEISQQVQLQRPIKVAIDCGNGIAGAFAGKLFRAIGAEVVELYCEVDGHFPNHHPDPSVAENLSDLIQVVQQEDCELGLAFDGDADRLGVVTNEGEIIWPDRQLILIARDILTRHPNAVMVYDIKCSATVESAILAANGQPRMCPTGHSIVKKTMKETGALLAGEMSGHIFINERWSGFDDGLYAGVRVLEILAKSARSATDQLQALPKKPTTPELKIAVAESEKFVLMKRLIDEWQFAEGECLYMDGLRWQTDDGWGLVRASNTSPYLIVRFEADSVQRLNEIQSIFREKLLQLDSRLLLPF